ncbi:MAG: alpha/beta fold hydrolase [Gammaproteobacteria bacterium]|nr:alpha/beta fold hydrolase [Gammaproteobacteria bacterium]
MINMSSSPGIESELETFRKNYRHLIDNIRRLESGQNWHTPNEICFNFEGMKIREFRGTTPSCPTPVLIVYSHVNLPHVIDLTEQHSMVRRLMEAGHKVYLVDWGQINGEARTRDLARYLHDYLDKSVNFILDSTGAKRVNLVGICQGGTFSLCYASLHPEKLGRLVTVVTPVDFHAGDGVLSKWARKIDYSPLESNPVNIPGGLITLFFQSLRPYDDMMRNIRLIRNRVSLDSLELTALVDQWVFECPDQPGRAFAQFMRLFYQENRLVRGGLQLGEHRIDLGNVRIPVLNLYANGDHLVPKESSGALKGFMEADRYTEMTYDGGHVGLMVSARAQRTILPAMGAWLAGQTALRPS